MSEAVRIQTFEVASGRSRHETLSMDVSAPMGARFFGHNRRELGWAASVAKRPPSLGGLTVLDVAKAEPDLAAHLVMLDKDTLVVRWDGVDAPSYRFAWVSGYRNGDAIRIQGILE